MQTQRCFVALPLPHGIRKTLAELHRVFDPSRTMPIRWVDESRIHVTLAFLGDVPRAWIPKISDGLSQACAQTPPMSLTVGPFGAFPSTHRPRVIWVGLEGEVDVLAHLQRDIARELRAMEVPFDDRPFAPHLTLGRLRHDAPRNLVGQVAERLALPVDVPDLRFVADHVEFVASHLGEAPPRYETLANLLLHGPESTGP